MATSYLNVKRYNIDPAMLVSASQKVIRDLGGNIVNTSHARIMADLPDVSGSETKELDVRVYLNGAIYATVVQGKHRLGIRKSKAVVEAFLCALDEHIKSIPKESLRSVREAFNMTTKRYIRTFTDIPS